MAKKDLTEIVCIVDKSGSMESIASDAIGGFNAFLRKQCEQPGAATMSVILFDTAVFQHAICEPLSKVAELNNENYEPDGYTALYDAVGMSINKVGSRLAELPESERPEQVIVAILTDGEENSSKEFTRQQVFEQIKRQTDEYNWQFLFLAANQDALRAGESIGISRFYSANIEASKAGIRHSFDMICESVSKYRKEKKLDRIGKDKIQLTGKSLIH